ncbi:MAG: hypothetical protein ACP5LH_00875 [Candidatus Micrarchaeia archaeon]
MKFIEFNFPSLLFASLFIFFISAVFSTILVSQSTTNANTITISTKTTNPTFSISFNILPSNSGLIIFNNIQYQTNNSNTFILGNYPINAIPNNNFVFSNWSSSNSANVSFENSSAQNTIVAINGNAVVNANFNTVKTNNINNIKSFITTTTPLTTPTSTKIIIDLNKQISNLVSNNLNNLNVPFVTSTGLVKNFNISDSLNSNQISNAVNFVNNINLQAEKLLNSVNLPQCINCDEKNPMEVLLPTINSITLSLPYGSVTNNSLPIPASNKQYSFLSYNNETDEFTIYNIIVVKAVPNVSLFIDGINFSTSSNELSSIIHPPIVNGRLGITGSKEYYLNVTIYANNLNKLNLSYYVKNKATDNIITSGLFNVDKFKKDFSINVPINQSVNIGVNVEGNANYINIDPVVEPVNIIGYVPITITNSQSTATSNPFQQAITVNSLAYEQYEAGNLQNIEFFYANGTIIPSWLESGNSNTSTSSLYWLKLISIPANSNIIIYMGFANLSTNLFNSATTGEAPELSSTYAEYDDGSNVFLNYFRGDSTSGWTINAGSGTTTSPSGAPLAGNSLYAYSARGDYMYTTASLNNPIIIQYFTYTTGLGDFFFTTSSSGAGTMSRLDSRGGYYIGLAKTASWTSWDGPNSGKTASAKTWYQWSIIVNGTEVADYYSTTFNYNSLGTVINPLSNTYTDSGGTETYTNNGNYIGIIGDALGSSYITYWQGIIVRAYPPNGIMPSASFGNIIINEVATLTITPNPITYGSTSTVTASANPNTDTIELFMNGNLVAGPSTGTLTYTFNSLSAGNGVGSYTFNAFDENSLKSSIETLIVNKATPSISLPNFPQSFIYTGSPVTINANIVSYNNQLLGNIYVNNTFIKSFNSITSFTEVNPNNYTVVANTIGDANYTSATATNTFIICPQVSNLPTSINAYSCIILNNSQTTATPNQFQQIINITESKFGNYITYNNNFANFEFFYANGTIIPAWIESNSSGILHIWIKTKSIPALSHILIYIGFANNTINLLSNSGTTGIGEAPKLSSTYAEYDDGSNVFLNYFSGSSLSGWTTAGTAGLTSSAPSGNPTFGTNAFYANGANGDYLYTTASGQSTNMIIEFYGYTANLQDLYFLVNSIGAGQMMRDGNGAGWYGIASTSSWTSWGAPPLTGTWSNEWVTIGIVVKGSSATGYLSTGVNIYGTEIGSNPTNQYSVANNGNYLGLVGDAASGTTTQYWSGIIVRAYPPNGIMPSASFTAIVGPPSLTITPNPITYGSTSTVTASANPNTDTIELFMNGNLVAGPSTGTLTYTFNSLSAGNGVGSYTFNAFDENSLKSSIETLIVNKATPSISLPNFPQSFIYTGSPVTINANIVSYNNQLLGNIYVNNTFIKSFNSITSFTEVNPNNYTVVANTIGDANYTSATATNTFIICPQVSNLPTSINAYSCIILNNSQTTATPNQFQQIINITESKFGNYITYNNNFANFEFFYANGTIIPAWIESNSSGILHIWIKTKSIPALSHILIYIGFANNTINLLSNSGTTGIGEAPKLSSTYAEYDDGSNVFLNYFSGSSLSGWTTAGTAGLTSSAPSGNPTFGTNAFYANGANGDYLYTTASGQSTNMIIEFYGYTANLQDLYFLVNSIGAGQMMRDGNGAGWYGIASTSSWTSWGAPPLTGTWSNEWVTIGIVVKGSSATGYLSTGVNIYGTEIGSNPTNQYSVANNGNYLGLVGDAASGTTTQYWSGIIVRAYPPNGIMPSASFTNVLVVPKTCTISLSNTLINFGSLTPSSSIGTINAITDSNSGGVNAIIYVYGGNWIVASTGANGFGVSNTTYASTYNVAYTTANKLSPTATDTSIVVPASGSNTIYFGVGIPGGASSGSYTQTITIENSC